jgi:predicted dehydrogenase
MDWHEGFQIYGENGSVLGKTYNPWYFRSSDVECFSSKDGQYHRALGADAHFYKLQLEAFADTILHDAPMQGATAADGTAAIRTLVAIDRSVKTGQAVRLVDVTGAI